MLGEILEWRVIDFLLTAEDKNLLSFAAMKKINCFEILDLKSINSRPYFFFKETVIDDYSLISEKENAKGLDSPPNI